MVYTEDFDALLKNHIESEADITVLYHSVDNAKEAYQSCFCLNLNRQKGEESIEQNNGKVKNRNIFHGYLCNEKGSVRGSSERGKEDFFHVHAAHDYQ